MPNTKYHIFKDGSYVFNSKTLDIGMCGVDTKKITYESVIFIKDSVEHNKTYKHFTANRVDYFYGMIDNGCIFCTTCRTMIIEQWARIYLDFIDNNLV